MGLFGGRSKDEESRLAAERAEENAREIERLEQIQEESDAVDLSNEIAGLEVQTQDDIAIASGDEPPTG